MKKKVKRKNNNNALLSTLSLIIASMMIVACQKDFEDIDAFIENEKVNRATLVPIPGYKPIEPFIYSAHSLGRDPFTRLDTLSELEEKKKQKKINRVLEPLEKYSTESIKYVGYITEPDTKRKKAILQTKDGEIHYGYIGDRIGNNEGTIRTIDDVGVTIVEIARSEQGGTLTTEVVISIE